jgi:hypothetical protein
MRKGKFAVIINESQNKFMEFSWIRIEDIVHTTSIGRGFTTSSTSSKDSQNFSLPRDHFELSNLTKKLQRCKRQKLDLFEKKRR